MGNSSRTSTAPVLTFERWHRVTRDLSPRRRGELFEHATAEELEDCWARLREQVEGERVLEGELTLRRKARPPRTSRRREGSRRNESAGAPSPLRSVDSTERCCLSNDVLLSIAPPVYFAALAAIDVPDHGGMVCCPLHDDRDPSCRVYAEAERGWVCFAGCGGGTIFDLRPRAVGNPRPWARLPRAAPLDR